MQKCHIFTTGIDNFMSCGFTFISARLSITILCRNAWFRMILKRYKKTFSILLLPSVLIHHFLTLAHCSGTVIKHWNVQGRRRRRRSHIQVTKKVVFCFTFLFSTYQYMRIIMLNDSGTTLFDISKGEVFFTTKILIFLWDF